MIPEYVRQMENPYFPISSRLLSHDFVGRSGEIEKLGAVVEEYQGTLKPRNVIISGEKSIGKSCLLNRYRQILEDHDFVTYEVELPRDSSIEIDEFEFFKDLINELFEKYAPPEGNFFDVIQSEIWFSLTADEYRHESDFKDRKIGFASQYANRKRRIDEKISAKGMERDFENIMDQLLSPDMGIVGLAILVDEFQELSRNVLILDILRQISEKVTGLMIIGAGLPTFLDNPIFEKFSRVSVPINLGNMGKNEILDLIMKPLEKRGTYSKHDVQNWFDPQSVYEIVERSGGNPLHVKILCAQMFDHYRRNPTLPSIVLNRQVMEDVMEYYSTISEKSRAIKLSLQSCSRDQLVAFGLLYRYGGFSLRAAILLELAFEPIGSKEEEAVKNKILSAFEDIWDLGLFEFRDMEIKLGDVMDLSSNGLAHIEYKFIGDAIDRLYASYYYEELTGIKLFHHEGASFEDVLALRLAEDFVNVLLSLNVPESAIVDLEPIVRIDAGHVSDDAQVKDIVKDLDILVGKTTDVLKVEKEREAVCEISERHGLGFAAHLASMLELEGYYLVLAEVNIKGKLKRIFSYFPVLTSVEGLLEIRRQIEDISVDNTSLDQYMVAINFVYAYWLPKQPLLVITYADVDKEKDVLYEKVAQRDLEGALAVASHIRALMTRVSLVEGKWMEELESLNNFGFCLLNLNRFEEAKVHLSECATRFLTSKINLAYGLHMGNDSQEARRILNRVVRKVLGKDQEMRFMHLAIAHPALPVENRLVEDVKLYNVAAWNSALINSQEGSERSRIYSLLKKVTLTKNEPLIDRRVRYWIDYYRGEIDRALESAREVLGACGKVEYLHRDVAKDIEIFESELRAVSSGN